MDNLIPTSIPGFFILRPQRMGLLDQFRLTGWKWYGPLGLWGEAVQMRNDAPDFLAERFVRFGHKWDRRLRLSPAHHLWGAAFRQRSEIDRLRRDIWVLREEPLRAVWPTANRIQRLALRWLFGYEPPPLRELYDEGD